LKELHDGRLRQGWGYQDDQDLNEIQKKWDAGEELSSAQGEASRHWRMGNGPASEGYMQKGDWVLLPNMPENSRFTICEVTGDYSFSRDAHDDYGHIRPVNVLTPEGVVNSHQLVHGDLRRSLRCRSRMWNIFSHHASLERAFKSRSRKGQYVIAVVLLVTNATASPELKERMRLMSEKYNIPFLYCGPDESRNIIGEGLLSHSIMKSYGLNSEA